MNPERIASELGARVRRFKTVQGVLLWYVEARSRRLLRSQNLGGAGGPMSRERQDEDQLLYALVSRCLTAWDREHDVEPFPLGDEGQAMARFGALAQWMRSSAEKGQQRMADEVGLSMAGASKYFGHVENVLRRRMRARGLIDERVNEQWSVP